MIDLFFSWYFIDVPKKIKHIWVNYLWFFEKYFAISELVKDYVSPWKGLYFEKESIGFDFGEMFYVWFSNGFSRFMGILIRSVALVIGAIVMIVIFLSGIAAFLIWAFFLFALVFVLFKGVQVLIPAGA
jgi:hypothetical protein